MTRNVTHREWEIAELIAFGLTEKEIANYLDISISTVHAHKNNLFNKTGCRNIADVTRWYIQETSGIRLEPCEAIKKLVSIFMLILVMLAEFSSSEFVRLRTRARAKEATTRVITTRRVRRAKENFYLQTA